MTRHSGCPAKRGHLGAAIVLQQTHRINGHAKHDFALKKAAKNGHLKWFSGFYLSEQIPQQKETMSSLRQPSTVIQPQIQRQSLAKVYLAAINSHAEILRFFLGFSYVDLLDIG